MKNQIVFSRIEQTLEFEIKRKRSDCHPLQWVGRGHRPGVLGSFRSDVRAIELLHFVKRIELNRLCTRVYDTRRNYFAKIAEVLSSPNEVLLNSLTLLSR